MDYWRASPRGDHHTSEPTSLWKFTCASTVKQYYGEDLHCMAMFGVDWRETNGDFAEPTPVSATFKLFVHDQLASVGQAGPDGRDIPPDAVIFTPQTEEALREVGQWKYAGRDILNEASTCSRVCWAGPRALRMLSQNRTGGSSVESGMARFE